jgi:hypothetical protein
MKTRRWSMPERELLAMEEAYLKQLSPFERLIDNHWSFLLSFIVITPICFGIGFLLGLLL